MEEFPSSLHDVGILQYCHVALVVNKFQHNSVIKVFILGFVSKREGGKPPSRQAGVNRSLAASGMWGLGRGRHPQKSAPNRRLCHPPSPRSPALSSWDQGCPIHGQAPLFRTQERRRLVKTTAHRAWKELPMATFLPLSLPPVAARHMPCGCTYRSRGDAGSGPGRAPGLGCH